MAIRHQFYIVDYVVFGLTILVSIGIGIFYAISGGRQKTTSEYLMGGRTMSFIPVAISLMVSFESSIMMLGVPAETYVYGIQIIIGMVGFLVSQMISIRIIVPLLHPLKITSAFEYLEYRFQSRAVRLMGVLMAAFSYVWYMGIVLFGPAVALEAVTGFPMWASIFTICLVAMIYTSIGGLKAVVWTDVFQAAVMFAGIFAILIKGTIEAGGAKAVWETAAKGGRLNFFNFDTDITVRHTFWGLFLGSLARGFGMTFNQSTVQRLNSTKSITEGKRVLYLVAPFFFLSVVLAMIEGIVAYAYYESKQCDPFESEQLTNPNQIVPYMVMDIFEGFPGMPGLFLAALFSASLSTLSTGLCSLSAMLWTDIVHPLTGDISEFKATIIAKASVFAFGLTACGIAMLVSLIGGTLIQIASTLLSAFGGPLTGLFLLGCFCPRAKAKGAMFGGIISFLLSSWISLGMNFAPGKKITPWLSPASTEQCDAFLNSGNSSHTFWMQPSTMSYLNTTTTEMTTLASEMMTTLGQDTDDGPQGINKIYSISYVWIGVIGIFTTVILGQLSSVIIGGNKPGDVDPRYILSITDYCLPFGPQFLKDYLSSIGPQFMKPEYKLKFPDPALKASKLEKEIIISNGDDNMTTTKLINDEDKDDVNVNNMTITFNNGSTVKVNGKTEEEQSHGHLDDDSTTIIIEDGCRTIIIASPKDIHS